MAALLIGYARVSTDQQDLVLRSFSWKVIAVGV